MKISAIIRTKNSESTIEYTINSLESQKDASFDYIFVDNSSTDNTRNIINSLCINSIIIDYTGPFNYSRAINIAIPFIMNEFTLIISSHTGLQNPRSAKEAIKAMVKNQQIAAVTFSSSTVGDIYFKETNQDNFDGWNGAWNTASIYRTNLLKNRNFREDVKSAEDQEWSKWVIHEKSKIIWHAEGCNAVNLNPKKGSFLKTLGEWESVSKYTYPKYVNTVFIAQKIYSAFSLLRKGKYYDSIIELGIAYTLFKAWILKFLSINLTSKK